MQILKSFLYVLVLGSQAFCADMQLLHRGYEGVVSQFKRLLKAAGNEEEEGGKSPVCADMQLLHRCYEGVVSHARLLEAEGNEEDDGCNLPVCADRQLLRSYEGAVSELARLLEEDRRSNSPVCADRRLLHLGYEEIISQYAGLLEEDLNEEEECNSPICADIQSLRRCYEAIVGKFQRLLEEDDYKLLDPTQLFVDIYNLTGFSQVVEQNFYKAEKLECDICHTEWQTLVNKCSDWRKHADQISKVVAVAEQKSLSAISVIRSGRL